VLTVREFSGVTSARASNGNVRRGGSVKLLFPSDLLHTFCPQSEQMKSTKKTKSENPFKLGAAVALFRPGSGVERLGQVVKITKSLLTVKWEDGSTELFGKSGQEFYGEVDKSRRAS